MCKLTVKCQTEEPARPGSGPSAPGWFGAMARVLPVIAYSVATIYFGTRRNLMFPGAQILNHDKILHAVAFGGLGALTYRCHVYLWPTPSNRQAVIAAIAFAATLGAVLELIQSRLPYRSMELADLFADCLGACLFVIVARRLGFERPLFGLGI